MPWILCLRNSSFSPPFKGDIEHQHGAGYSGEPDKVPATMSEPGADSEWTIRYRIGGWWMKWRCHCTQQGQGRPLWCLSWDLSKGGTETTSEKVFQAMGAASAKGWGRSLFGGLEKEQEAGVVGAEGASPKRLEVRWVLARGPSRVERHEGLWVYETKASFI